MFHLGVISIIFAEFVRDVNVVFCLGQGGDTVCEGRDDRKEFADIRSAMKVLTFSDEEIWDILKILSSLLHLGNVTYKGYNG